MEIAERRAVLSGLGQSEIGRRLAASSLELTTTAILAAIADAGLEVSDIDGIVGAHPPGVAASFPGIVGPDPVDVQDALGIASNWQLVSVDGLQNAVLAVAGGVARHVVVYRTVTEGRAAKDGGGRKALSTSWQEASGDFAWSVPIGVLSGANICGLFAQRHMHQYGVTREQLGQLVVTQRSHAALNPSAIYQSPLDLDDYLSARMISSPLCLYDCDVPVDASTAVIVSRRETATDLRRPVAIEAMAMSSHGRSSFGQWEDMTTMAFHDSAAKMWSRTDLTPSDVDTAQLYDGFSYLCLLWLEALGFCGPGESGLFVEKAERITFGGELPLNTWGGQLSAGRLHIGFGHCAEAIRQLRGEAGPRQVSGAEVSIFSMGIAHVANCMLLTSL